METRIITAEEDQFLEECAEKIAYINLYHILVNDELKKFGITSIDSDADYAYLKSVQKKYAYLLD